MVGFIHQDEGQETNPSAKLKNPLHSTCSDKFDFLDQFVPEVQDFPLPVNSSLLDFDSITDWIEEMQDSDADKCSDNPCLEDAELQNLQNIPTNERNQSSLNCITAEGNFSMPEINGELIMVDGSGECLDKESIGFSNLSVEEDAEELLSLNCMVEEGLGIVSMVDEVVNPIDQSSLKDNAIVSEVVEADSGSLKDNAIVSKVVEAESGKLKDNAIVSEVVEAESDESSASESERGSSSDSLSSSSSSSSEDEDDVVAEGRNDDVVMGRVCEVKEELEEGEIMETNACKGNFSKGGASGEILIDDDEEDVVVGPIMSKNELKVLPPVPPVDVTLQPSHQMLPVGIVNSILGAQVIVEGGEKHNPLSEGSVLWITSKKCPLGRVDEIFGPVKNPYYIVRYNSESEVPEGIEEGCLVSFVAEFAEHVLKNKNLYQKGYDASGNDDEEVEEAEFSDDEQEAEYRRMIKMSKRSGNNKADGGPRDYKKSNKSLIRDDARSNNSSFGPAQSFKMHDQQQFQSPAAGAPPNLNNVHRGFSQVGQPSGLGPSGVQPSGYQQMPFIQQPQNVQAHPMRPPFQQAFNPNNNIPPSYHPGTGMVPPNQVPISMALQAQLAQLSMLSGMLLAGQQQQQSGPPSIPQSAPQFNPFQSGAAPPFQSGAAPPFQSGAAPPFQSGAAPPFQSGAATPFQARGGRFRGRGRGGRRGGGRSF